MAEKLCDTHPLLLLVEDDAEIREQMKWALASDYTVVEADDRRSAMAAIKRETPHLVMLDLGLPLGVDESNEEFAILQEILQFSHQTKLVLFTCITALSQPLAAIDGVASDSLE